MNRNIASGRTLTSNRYILTTFLLDKFSGPNSNAITSHTPDIFLNGVWSQTNASSFYLQNNTLEANRKIDGDLATINCGQSNFNISANLTAFGDASNGGTPGIVFRYVDSSNFWYVYLNVKFGLVHVYSVDSGASTEYVHVSSTITSGAAYLVTVKCLGSKITIYINTKEIMTILSSLRSTATIVGFRYGSYGTGGRSVYSNLSVIPFSGLVLDWPIFSEYASNPIVSLGAVGNWDNTDVNDANVIYDSVNSRFVLLYSGYGNVGNVQALGLSYASTILGSWTKEVTNPVFTGGGVYGQNGGIVKLGTTYYYYYGTNSGSQIACATSSNLLTWVDNGVILSGTASTWDSSGVFDAFARLRQDGKTIELWYGGKNGSRAIGYATSTDGLTFTKYASNPLFTSANNSFYDANFGEPAVYVPPNKEGKEMLVTFDSAVTNGKRYISGALTLNGGSTWHYVTRILSKGSGWNANQVFDSFIMLNSGVLYLFHSGANVDGGALNLNIQLGVASYTPVDPNTFYISGS